MNTGILTGNCVTEVELHYISKVKASERKKVLSVEDAYHVFKNSWNEDTIELLEEFKVLMLNNSKRVLGIYTASQGVIALVSVDIRLVFACALKLCACGIIICHNHPSGSLLPSSADKQLTERFRAAGKLLDIALLDHLLISSESYYSFADEGVIL
jgi:DNA repair protein RadC